MVVIALDIGGTKIKAAILSRNYSILSSVQIPTLPKKGRAYFLQNFKLIVDSIIKGSKHKITSIGISMPGILNDKGKLSDIGTALSFLEGYNFRSYLEKNFSIPVKVENDANCFLLAESVLGSAKKYEKVLGIIWGTGIGAALSINGSIVNFPIEFGHNKVLYDNKYVDLELVSGGPHIIKNYKRQKGKLSSPDIPKLFSSNEKIAKQVTKDAVNYLGLELSKLINILNPDVVVLGGGLSQLPKSVYNKLFIQIKKYSLPNHMKKFKLLKYSISDDAGLFGAAILAYKKK